MQSGKGVLSTLCLVRYHSSDGSPQNLGWCPEVDGTVAGLDVASFPQEGKISHYAQKSMSVSKNVEEGEE